MDLLMFFFADLSAPAAVSLGIGVFATVSIPVVLLASVGVRPLLARAIRSEAVYPLLREWDNARHDACELASAVALDARLSLRHAALTGAALAALLFPATEGTR